MLPATVIQRSPQKRATVRELMASKPNTMSWSEVRSWSMPAVGSRGSSRELLGIPRTRPNESSRTPTSMAAPACRSAPARPERHQPPRRAEGLNPSALHGACGFESRPGHTALLVGPDASAGDRRVAGSGERSRGTTVTVTGAPRTRSFCRRTRALSGTNVVPSPRGSSEVSHVVVPTVALTAMSPRAAVCIEFGLDVAPAAPTARRSRSSPARGSRRSVSTPPSSTSPTSRRSFPTAS